MRCKVCFEGIRIHFTTDTISALCQNWEAISAICQEGVDRYTIAG